AREFRSWSFAAAGGGVRSENDGALHYSGAGACGPGPQRSSRESSRLLRPRSALLARCRWWWQSRVVGSPSLGKGPWGRRSRGLRHLRRSVGDRRSTILARSHRCGHRDARIRGGGRGRGRTLGRTDRTRGSLTPGRSSSVRPVLRVGASHRSAPWGAFAVVNPGAFFGRG